MSSGGRENSQVKKCVWFQVKMDVHRKIAQRKGLQLIVPNDLSVGAVGGPSVRRPQLKGGARLGGPECGGAAGRQRGARPAGHPRAARCVQTTHVSVLVMRGWAGTDRQ